MADTKISNLTELTVPPDSTDEFVLVDKSDTSEAASGTDKRIKAQTFAPLIVRKTADETVNNSNALQNDNHLALAVDASSVYRVELTLLVSATGTAADWLFGFTVPASATLRWGATGTGNNTIPWAPALVATTPGLLLTESQSEVHGSASGVHGFVVVGMCVTAGSSGTLQFQWAQNTATVADSKVLTNSVLIAQKIG